tara:strand:+ start:446 stop:637 length:192 start_codon:yes stop_codon:yes gene_type:complete
MINNETIVTASLFGISAGITTSSMFAILIGAVAVGVVQPFFRVLWTKKLNEATKCSKCKKKRK